MAQKQTKHTSPGNETAVVTPRAPRPRFGFARSKDLHDRASQEQAPSGPRNQYDRTGDEEYAERMESFEDAGGSTPRRNRERSGTGNRKRPPD